METIKIGQDVVTVCPAAVKGENQKIAEVNSVNLIDTLLEGNLNPYDIVLMFVGCDGFDYYSSTNLTTLFQPLIRLKIADSKTGTNPELKMGSYVSASETIEGRPITFIAVYAAEESGASTNMDIVEEFLKKLSNITPGRKMIVVLNTINPPMIRPAFVDLIVKYLPEATLWASNRLKEMTIAQPYNVIESE